MWHLLSRHASDPVADDKTRGLSTSQAARLKRLPLSEGAAMREGSPSPRGRGKSKTHEMQQVRPEACPSAVAEDGMVRCMSGTGSSHNTLKTLLWHSLALALPMSLGCCPDVTRHWTSVSVLASAVATVVLTVVAAATSRETPWVVATRVLTTLGPLLLPVGWLMVTITSLDDKFRLLAGVFAAKSPGLSQGLALSVMAMWFVCCLWACGISESLAYSACGPILLFFAGDGGRSVGHLGDSGYPVSKSAGSAKELDEPEPESSAAAAAQTGQHASGTDASRPAVSDAVRAALASLDQEGTYHLVHEAQVTGVQFEPLVQDFLAESWNEDTFMLGLYLREGATEVSTLPWLDVGDGPSPSCSSSVCVRQVTIRLRVPPSPMCPSTTRSTVTFRVSATSEGNVFNKLVIESSCVSHDIPFGESFYVQERYELLPLSTPGDGVQVKKSFRLKFLKGAGFMGSIIQKAASAEQAKSGSVLVSALESRRPPCAGSGAEREEMDESCSVKIWELQRRATIFHTEWHAPFLPHDGDKRWRWVDDTFQKHRWTRPSERGESADAERPPLASQEGWVPGGQWSVQSAADGTGDADGWQYAIDFHRGDDWWGPMNGGLSAKRAVRLNHPRSAQEFDWNALNCRVCAFEQEVMMFDWSFSFDRLGGASWLTGRARSTGSVALLFCLQVVHFFSENKTMSKSVEDNGNYKCVQATTVRRLAQFLGVDSMLKDGGISCHLLIANKPHGVSVTDRAIPVKIFFAEEEVKKVWLRCWLQDASLDDFDMRTIIDWDYYKDRLCAVFQKLICIPACYQKIANPCPRVAVPEWLRKRVAEQNDRFQQRSLGLFFKKTAPDGLGLQDDDGAAKRKMGDMEDLAGPSNVGQLPTLEFGAGPKKWLEVQHLRWAAGQQGGTSGAINTRVSQGWRASLFDDSAAWMTVSNEVLKNNWHIVAIEPSHQTRAASRFQVGDTVIVEVEADDFDDHDAQLGEGMELHKGTIIGFVGGMVRVLLDHGE
ncbi:unnamed protein product, partial [Polarella glacialis]